jgi:hypothetical protein
MRETTPLVNERALLAGAVRPSRWRADGVVE